MKINKDYFANVSIILLSVLIITMSFYYVVREVSFSLPNTINNKYWKVVFNKFEIEYDNSTVSVDNLNNIVLSDEKAFLDFDIIMGINQKFTFAVNLYNNSSDTALLNDYLVKINNQTDYISYQVSLEDGKSLNNLTLTPGSSQKVIVEIKTTELSEIMEDSYENNYHVSLMMNLSKSK